MKKVFSKPVAWLLVVLMIVGILTPVGLAEDKEKVTLRFVKAGTEEEQREYYEKALAEFTALTGIEVIYEDVGWADIDTKLNMAYAVDEAPDVIRYAISSVAQRASMGQYEDLTDRLNAWEGKDDIIPSALEGGEYKGRNYGIGVFVGHSVMLWRKDYFEEAGLDPDTPPTNHEELLDYARKLTIYDEQGNILRAGVSIPTSGQAHHHVLPIVMQLGGEVVDIENNVPTFNTPEYEYALNYLHTFKEENLLLPYTMQVDTNPFLYGKAAIAYQGDSVLYRNVITADPELRDKIGIALQPFYGDIKASFGGAQLLFMSSNSEHKEEAWQLITFLLSKEQIWSQYEIAATPPVLYSLKDQYIADDPDVNSVIFDAMTYTVGNPKVTWASLYITYLQQAFEQVMCDEKSPHDALEQAQEDLLSEIQ